MKKYIIAFLLCAFSVCGYTQKSFIKDALKRGPNEEGIYRVENPKGKNLRKGELEEAIINMGYLPISGKGWFKGSDFDDWRSRVGYYDFIDNKNYPKYIFCKLRGSDSEYKYSQLKNRGYFFIPTKKREKKNSSMPWTEYKTVYDLNRQTAFWSGDIVNGYLHGGGCGFIISSRSYQWFAGIFYEGLPIYNFHIRSVNTNGMSAILDDSRISYNPVIPINHEICMRHMNSSDSEIKRIVNNYVTKGAYKDKAQLIEYIHRQTRSLSTSNCMDFKPSKEVTEFIDSYENANYDPDNVLPKAHEIYKVYTVVEALNLRLRDKYYSATLFGGGWSWDQQDVTDHRTALLNGLYAAREGKINSKYGYQNFFSSAFPILDKKYNNFEEKVEKQRLSYNNWVREHNKERAERLERERHEVDTENQVSPSGELVGHSFFGRDGFHYENDGKLHSKNGTDFCYYNIHFDNDKKIDYYYITSCSSKVSNYLNGKYKYKTNSELISAFMNAIR